MEYIYAVRFLLAKSLTRVGSHEAQLPMAGDTKILEKLLDGYDSRVRPRGQDDELGGAYAYSSKHCMPGMRGPVRVTVNCLFRTISKIDDINMVCGVACECFYCLPI
jgi:hypothetical protein